jgi:hypothetical protein
MKTRLVSSLLIVLVLLAGVVPAVNAQGGDNTLTCYNLSADDCNLLVGAIANSENIQSFNMNFSLDFSLSGLSMLGAMTGSGADSGMPGDITFHVEGSGPFAMVTSDTFPPIIMDLAMNAMLNSGSDSQSGNMEVRIVDGYVYFTDPTTGEWSGTLIEDAMQAAETDLGITGLLPSSGDMPQGQLNPQDLLGTDPNALMQAAGLSGTDAASLLEIPGFINHVRLDDQDNMHVFELTIDFAPLFASTEFQNIVNAAITQATASDPNAAQTAMMVPMLLGGLTGNVVETQKVGIDDNFIHGVGLNLNMTLDLAALMPPSSSTSSNTPQLPPIDLVFSFNVDLDQINQTFEVAAPEGATILTAEDLKSGSGM